MTSLDEVGFTETPSYDLTLIQDFTGGLRLTGDGFDVAGNESPWLKNVDIIEAGGVQTRSGVNPIHATALPATVKKLFFYENEDSDSTFVFASLANGDVWFQPDFLGEFTKSPVPTATKPGRHPWRGIQVNFHTYVYNGVDKPVYFYGVGTTVLDQDYNDDDSHQTGTNGNMPIAHLMDVHQGFLWAADIVEPAEDDNQDPVRHANRVRRSWALTDLTGEQDWDETEYIDIDIGHDGDSITAMRSCGDRLYIWKGRSVHVLAGWNEDNFQTFPVDQATGAVGHDAVICAEGKAWYFDGDVGLMSIQGNTPQWEFEQLYEVMGDIDHDRRHLTSLGICDRKLMLSIPVVGDEPWRTFSRDLTKSTGWTEYCIKIGHQAEFRPQDGASQCLFASGETNYVLRSVKGRTTDAVDGTGPRAIQATACTAWFGSHQGAIPNPFAEKTIFDSQAWVTLPKMGASHPSLNDPLDVGFFTDFSNVNSVPSRTIERVEYEIAPAGHPAGNTNQRHHACLPPPASCGDVRAIQLCFSGAAPWALHTMLLKTETKRIEREPT